MTYPKRLIEVDLPIKRISAHARREKSIRHGHISTLHIWWARRPLAACRAAASEVALTANECNTAKRLRKDYCLYVVFHCAAQPTLNILRDPSTLDWQPVTKIEHYRLRQDSIANPVALKEEPLPYRTGGAA